MTYRALSLSSPRQPLAKRLYLICSKFSLNRHSPDVYQILKVYILFLNKQ